MKMLRRQRHEWPNGQRCSEELGILPEKQQASSIQADSALLPLVDFCRGSFWRGGSTNQVLDSPTLVAMNSISERRMYLSLSFFISLLALSICFIIPMLLQQVSLNFMRLYFMRETFLSHSLGVRDTIYELLLMRYFSFIAKFVLYCYLLCVIMQLTFFFLKYRC